MAFVKGVHRFIFNTTVDGSTTGIVPYKATDDGAWQELEDYRIYTDAFYPENFATVIKNALNTVFDNKCVKIENTDSNVNRVGIGIPNADGSGTSDFTIELSATSSSKWVRGSAVASSDEARIKIGVTSNGALSAKYGDFCMGRMVYSSSGSTNVNSSTFKFGTAPLIMKVVIADNYYTIGLNTYMSVPTVDSAKSTFIDTNIIIGKTTTNKDYLLYGLGYGTSSNDYSQSTCMILKDSEGELFQDGFYFEKPNADKSGYAKLIPISLGEHRTGWYYAPKQYTTIYGDWNKSYSEVDKSTCLGTYLTTGIVENVITVDNKSFDALIGFHQYMNRNGLYRKHGS